MQLPLRLLQLHGTRCGLIARPARATPLLAVFRRWLHRRLGLASEDIVQERRRRAVTEELWQLPAGAFPYVAVRRLQRHVPEAIATSTLTAAALAALATAGGGSACAPLGTAVGSAAGL